MKVDTVIRRRFEELEQKATYLLANKALSFRDQQGTSIYTVDAVEFLTWSTSTLSLLQRVFGENSIHFQHFRQHQTKAYTGDIFESHFERCRAIFQAAREDYEGGYLFDIRGLIRAEVFSDVLEQATGLLQAGYKDAACVVTGVALETTLKELCARNGIPVSKLDRMNADLCKAGIYNMGMQKQITAWAERRNKAAHGDWNEYNAADVEDMTRGVTRLIAEYL